MPVSVTHLDATIAALEAKVPVYEEILKACSIRIADAARLNTKAEAEAAYTYKALKEAKDARDKLIAAEV